MRRIPVKMGRYHQMATLGVVILMHFVRLTRAGQRAPYVLTLSAAYRSPYAMVNIIIGDSPHVSDS